MPQTAREKEGTRRDFVASLAGKNRQFYGTDEGRGVLRALDLTFDERWMYVFELIQNGLDANADKMSFRVEQDNALVFEHNGVAPITEPDVEGISKVFRSTKGASTVGFMGIGFKSVFRRYRKASVSGWGWKFRFDVPLEVGQKYKNVHRDMLGSVTPIWDESLDDPAGDFTTMFKMWGLVDDASIQSDLSHLLDGVDKPLLPILARAGLKQLDLDGQRWEFGTNREGAHVHEVTALSNDEDRLWQVFSVDCTPSDGAVKRFLEHRDIHPSPEEQESVYRAASRPRPVVGILPLDDKGLPAPPRQGQVHAVLPTALKHPFGLHVSADWLLNISRTGLKEIEGNEWQRDMVDTMADLLVRFVRWIASLRDEDAIAAAFGALRVPSADGGGVATLLVREGWRKRLQSQICNERVFPAWGKSGDLSFHRASSVLVPPAPLAEAFREEPRLKPAALLGGRVLADSVLGQGARSLLGGNGILSEMNVGDLHRAWDGGQESWWSSLDGDANTKRDLLFRLWTAVAECGEGHATLPCVRTDAGKWVGVNRVSYFNESLPSEQTPGGSQVRDFLLSHRPASEHLVPPQWMPPLRRRDGPSGAWDWLSENAREISLKELVDDAIAGLAGAKSADWSILVPLGQWARHLQRPDLLTHVLVDDPAGQVGRPIKEVLLAEPYVLDGAIRRQLSRCRDVVSGDYVATDGDVGGWAKFLADSGAFGDLEVWREERTAFKQEAESFAGVDMGYATSGRYKLVDFELRWTSDQRVFSGLSMPDDAEALAKWLENGSGGLRGFGRRRVEYFHYSEKASMGTKRSAWATTLTELRWVPCKDGQFRRPSAVLAGDDEVRDDAPVADLRAELVEVLEAEGIRFGTDIPEAPSLRRLQKVGNRLEPADLAELLQEVQESVQGEDDLAHFHNAVASLEIPVGHDRFPINRVVRRSGGSSRGLLGGYLVAMSDIDDVLRRRLVDAGFPYRFPETTTGTQALAFLEDVWQRAKYSPARLADEVRGALPTAYAYVRQDMQETDDLLARWNQVLPNAMLFSGRQWLALRGDVDVFFDDIEDRRFMPTGAEIHFATSGHLGESRQAREATAAVLGLERLSSVCQLEWRESGSSEGTGRAHRIGAIWELLRVVQGGEAGEGGSAPQVDNVASLRLTVHMRDRSEEVSVHARLHEDRLILAGDPIQFAADAAKELLRAYGFGQRADLATDLTLMLAAIDDPDALLSAERKFRRAFLSEDQQTDTDQAVSESAVPPTVPDTQTDFPPPGAGDTDDTGDGSTKRPLGSEAPSEPKASPSHTTGKAPQTHGGGKGTTDGDPSYTSERAKARQRALAGQLQGALKGEISPGPQQDDNTTTDGDKDAADEKSLGDEVYRAVVLQYERECGRVPDEGDPSQVGWDIRSVDPASKRERLIEVKGRGRPWDDTEVVELSRAQVAKAFNARTSTSSDWWLYVVERIDDDGFRVLPIPNPAEIATKWMLEGGAWRQIADNPRSMDAGTPLPSERRL